MSTSLLLETNASDIQRWRLFNLYLPHWPSNQHLRSLATGRTIEENLTDHETNFNVGQQILSSIRLRMSALIDTSQQSCDQTL